MSSRAAVYCRISDDRTGRALGVDRQRVDCEELAARKGLTVVHRFTDNDLSAYSGKPRPAYLAMLDAIGAGALDVVLAWHPDRLHRSPVELEDFITIVERAGVGVETVQAGQWDLSTPSGRLVARQLGNVARYESEHKSERVRRALEQNAGTGRTHGRPGYGWLRDIDEQGNRFDRVDQAEADVVRGIAQGILAGQSIRTITADLNSRAVPSPRGGVWAKNMVRHLVLRERNAGLRVHRGQVVGDGAWEPILEPELYEQVRAVLADPARRTSTGSAAAHLLSGLARCGVCGAGMRFAMNRTVPSYRCSGSSCVSRRKEDVDWLVTEAVTRRLARPDAADLLAPDRSGQREAAAQEARTLRARLDTAADEYADGKIDARQLERITLRLKGPLKAAETRARTVDDFPLLAGLVGEERAAEVWATRSLAQRRAIVATLVDVTVLRTSPGRRDFDPESIEIRWKAV